MGDGPNWRKMVAVSCQGRGTVPSSALWPVQGPEIRDHLSQEGIQVEVADQFQAIRLRLHHDGLVPVLEEMPHALVAAVEGVPQSGMRRLRILRGKGQVPVRTRRWAWFGRSAQA